MPRESGASSTPWYQFCFTMRAATYWIARFKPGDDDSVATD
jgi:hypothetical protein